MLYTTWNYYASIVNSRKIDDQLATLCLAFALDSSPGATKGGVLIGLRYGHNCMASAAESGRGTRGAGIAERMETFQTKEGVS
jgi:hypothetical protein